MADIVVTPASVRYGAGAVTVTGVSGEAILAGQAVALDAADSKYYLSDANSGTTARKRVDGLAVSSAPGADQKITIQTSGEFNPGGTVVVGTIYIMSGTPGGIAPSTDSVSGWTVAIIGVGKTSTLITLDSAQTAEYFFNPGSAVP